MPRTSLDSTATIEVVFRPSHYEQPVIIALDLDRRFWDLSPLPRDRELLWAGASHQVTGEQCAHRRQLANMVAQTLAPKIADAIVESIAAQDTINGYSPEEWRQMMAVPREIP